MQVLLVHERYAPDYAGGGEYLVQEVAEGLARKGADVRVLTTGQPRHDRVNAIPVNRIPVSRYRLNAQYRQVVQAAQEVDIIQTFNYHACYPALLAGRRLGRPVVCEMLGLFGDEWLRMKGPVLGRGFRAWERWLVRLPFDRTVFLSPFSAEVGRGLGVPESRLVVNVPGIDHARCYSYADKDLDVLFVGKFDARKGIEDVLAVARALPDLQFRLIGWGDRLHSVRAEAPANTVVEEFQRGCQFEAFARARVFFFPSRAETFGLVVAEAMASACAVVSTVPLPFEGAHVMPGDRQKMIEAVQTLCANPNRARVCGAENVMRARAYTWESHIEILLQVYHDLLTTNEQEQACVSPSTIHGSI